MDLVRCERLFVLHSIMLTSIIWRELYVWASTVMSSRCFPGPAAFNQPDAHDPTYNDDPEGKAPVLIPGLDLLNHDPCSKVAWMWDIHSYILKTDERLEGGAEVFNNYGPKSNEACEYRTTSNSAASA